MACLSKPVFQRDLLPSSAVNYEINGFQVLATSVIFKSLGKGGSWEISLSAFIEFSHYIFYFPHPDSDTLIINLFSADCFFHNCNGYLKYMFGLRGFKDIFKITFIEISRGGD